MPLAVIRRYVKAFDKYCYAMDHSKIHNDEKPDLSLTLHTICCWNTGARRQFCN